MAYCKLLIRLMFRGNLACPCFELIVLAIVALIALSLALLDCKSIKMLILLWNRDKDRLKEKTEGEGVEGRTID